MKDNSKSTTKPNFPVPPKRPRPKQTWVKRAEANKQKNILRNLITRKIVRLKVIRLK